MSGFEAYLASDAMITRRRAPSWMRVDSRRVSFGMDDTEVDPFAESSEKRDFGPRVNRRRGVIASPSPTISAGCECRWDFT